MPVLKYNFIPYNVDINELEYFLIGKHKKVNQPTSLLTDKVLTFLSLIVKKLINQMYFDDKDKRFVYINHKERRCLLGDKYGEIIEKLVFGGWLIENPNWHYNDLGKNTYTKSYALPEWMFSDSNIFKRVEISERKSVQKMITKFGQLRVKDSNDQWRTEMISSSKRILIHSNPQSFIAVEAHINKINNQNRKYRLSINAEEFIDIFNHSAFDRAVVDHFGKRVHTKITRLPKKLRQFLYFEGRENETLGCVDIVNSQPLFMSIASADLLKRFTPELEEAIKVVDSHIGNGDIKKFNKYCGEGAIYESIIKYFETKGVEIDRDLAKTVCYTSFFGNYNPYELGKIKDDFKNMSYEFLKSEYPGFYYQFKEMKSDRWQETGNKIYANNCILAQRLESQIFYQVIVPAIWNAGFRDFSTIHDSIICPESDMEAIQQIMATEFQKLNIKLKLSAKSTIKDT